MNKLAGFSMVWKKSGWIRIPILFIPWTMVLGLANTDCSANRTSYEHSTRVPFIIKGPDIPKGKTVEARSTFRMPWQHHLPWLGCPSPNMFDLATSSHLPKAKPKISIPRHLRSLSRCSTFHHPWQP